VESLRREKSLRGKERLMDTMVWRVAGVGRRKRLEPEKDVDLC